MLAVLTPVYVKLTSRHTLRHADVAHCSTHTYTQTHTHTRIHAHEYMPTHTHIHTNT